MVNFTTHLILEVDPLAGSWNLGVVVFVSRPSHEWLLCSECPSECFPGTFEAGLARIIGNPLCRARQTGH